MRLLDALIKGDERLDGTCVGSVISVINDKVVGCAIGAIQVGLLTDYEWEAAKALAGRPHPDYPNQRTSLATEISLATGKSAYDIIGDGDLTWDIVHASDSHHGNRDVVKGYVFGKDLADVEISR